MDRPQAQPIRVSFSRVRRCPREVADTYWPRKTRAKRQAADVSDAEEVTEEEASESESAEEDVELEPDPPDPEPSTSMDVPGVWSGRLRSCRCSVGDALTKGGDM